RPGHRVSDCLDCGFSADALGAGRPVRRGETTAAAGRQGQYPEDVWLRPATLRPVFALHGQRSTRRLRHLVSEPDRDGDPADWPNLAGEYSAGRAGGPGSVYQRTYIRHYLGG